MASSPHAGIGPLGAGEVRATGAIGVAVVGDPGDVVVRGSVVDEPQLVLDVRERREDLAIGERIPDAPAPGGAVARLAAPVHLGADAERAAGRLGLVGDATRAYMNPHSGSRLSAPIAQNGIRWRALYAATTGVSGFGGGGPTGAAAAARGAGPVAAGVAAAAWDVVAGVAAGVVEAGSALGFAAETEGGAALAASLQQVFGDLGHSRPLTAELS